MLIALQYWQGDEAEALSLARLVADIEQERREDVVLVLARAFDCELSSEAVAAQAYCQAKMQTILLRSSYQRVGHPDGCFGVWAGTVTALHRMWIRQRIPWDHHSVATFEADGCPVRPDWIGRLRTAHERTLAQGLRITGPVMDEPWPHVNGNLCMHLSVVADFPSLRECPRKVAWDVHHAPILLPLTRPCGVIRNEYGTKDWTEGCVSAIAKEAAWIANVKDESILRLVRGWMKTPAWKERRNAKP